MATWLADRRAQLPRRRRPVAGGWLARARRLLEPLEPVPRARLARLSRGLPRPRPRATPRRRTGSRAAEIGRRWACRTSRCSGWRSRAPRSSHARDVDEGMRRLDEATAAALEGRRARSRSRAPGPSASSSRACSAGRATSSGRSTWCDRIAGVRGALQQPVHARLLPGRVRRRAPSGAAGGAEAETRAGSRRGRLRALAPGLGAAARSRRLAELRRRQGRAVRCRGAARPGRRHRPAAQLCRARLGPRPLFRAPATL